MLKSKGEGQDFEETLKRVEEFIEEVESIIKVDSVNLEVCNCSIYEYYIYEKILYFLHRKLQGAAPWEISKGSADRMRLSSAILPTVSAHFTSV